MKTKLFTLLLAVAASVGTMFASTKIGDLYYNLNYSNLTAEVTYKSYRSSTSFYGYYNEGWNIETAIIPDSIIRNGKTYYVTSIGDNAFNSCTKLRSITIPIHLSSIASSAFANCNNITDIVWNAKNCNGYSFGNKIKSFSFGNSVEVIPSSLCSGMAQLTSVAIPNSVKNIGSSAFKNCSALSSVYINDLASWCSITFNDNPLLCAHRLYVNEELVTNLVIPNNVTTIASSAFSGCSSLTSITIPNNVTTIGSSAFSGCSSLTSITIPNNITTIGSSAFSDCSNLKTVTLNSKSLVEKNYLGSYFSTIFGPQVTKYIIGTNVTSIGSSAFSQCTKLTAITIPSNVVSIGSWAFGGCSSLAEISITESTSNISSNSFVECSVQRINYSGNLEQWCKKQWSAGAISWSYTLYIGGQKISNVVIPSTITELREGAFAGCTSLTSVTIPGSVTRIGDAAFYGCTGLTSVTIPNSVTTIERSAFSGCSNLTSVTIHSNAAVNVTGSTCYDSGPCIAGVSQIFGFQVKNIILGDSITSLPAKAFESLSNLTSITIGKNVKSIASNAFSGCSNITSVTWNAKNCNGYNFGSQVKTFKFGSEVVAVPASVCKGMTKLTSVTISNSVTSIGSEAFSGCTGLTSITIPGQVKTIGASAFSGCTGFTSATIPMNVTNIGTNAFSGCTNLTSVVWNAKNCNGYNFGSQVKTFKFGSEVVAVPASVCKGMTKLTSVTISNSVTSIGSEAFSGCTGLTSITIPNSVTSIGSEAFSGCTGLTSITIPASVTSIGSKALGSCPGLSSINVEEGNTKYDSRDNCNAIILSSTRTIIFGCKNTSIPNSVTSIGDYAFNGCSSLKSIVIPSNVTNVDSYAFNGCSGLTAATLSDNMTTIKSYTFNNCSKLSSVIIGMSVTNIESNAFSGCSSLKTVTLNSNAITSKDYTVSSNIANIFGSQVQEYILGRNISRIGAYAFHSCSEVKFIRYLRETPPSGPTSALDNICYSVAGGNYALIYIPCGTLSTFRQSWWSRYFTTYAPLKYKVTGVVNSEEMGHVFSPYSECDDLIAEANEGYHFVQWNDGVTENPRHVNITKDTTFKAIFAINEYVIKWENDDGTTLEVDNSVSHGTMPIYNGNTPSKSSTEKYTYTFVGWTPNVTIATNDTTYIAKFDSIINKYTIIWQNEDGSLIDQTTVEYGQIPAHANPVKQNTAEYTYTFAGWTPAVVAVTGNATYKATFSATKNKYLITFRDENGTELKSEEVEYGVMPIAPADPIKESTAQYDYTFAGWTPTIMIVTQAATYTATYTSTIREYLVTFLNEDNTVISSKNYKYGETPVAPADPIKQNTAEYTYTFNGWDNVIAQVQGPQTYKATYTATKNSYTITWQNEDGSLIDQTTVEYGVVPTHAEPTKEATEEYTYTFSGWTPAVVAVTGDATYKATFSSVVNVYTISVSAANGQVIGGGEYQYGTTTDLTAIPDEGYVFDQWSDGVTDNPRTITVTGDAEYTALFTSTEGFENIYTSEPVQKVIIDQKIFILRGEKTYTLTGQETIVP